MKTIKVTTEDCEELIPIKDTPLNVRVLLEGPYISSNGVGELNDLATYLDEEDCNIDIQVKYESVMDVLSLIGIDTLWGARPMKEGYIKND